MIGKGQKQSQSQMKDNYWNAVRELPPIARKFLTFLAMMWCAAMLLVVHPSRLSAEDGLTSQQAIAIVEELKQIRSLLNEILRANLASNNHHGDVVSSDPSGMVLSIKGHPAKGKVDAKLTVVEFSDYQCPFCGKHFTETLPQIEREFIEIGKVRYVFRDFPLEKMHPKAFEAARAANCAGEQGFYWEMHDWLFANQQGFNPDSLATEIEHLNLNVEAFTNCLRDNTKAGNVQEDIKVGLSMGVQGTPTFFIGITKSDAPDVVHVLRVIRGAQRYEAFKAVFDDLLG